MQLLYKHYLNNIPVANYVLRIKKIAHGILPDIYLFLNYHRNQFKRPGNYVRIVHDNFLW